MLILKNLILQFIQSHTDGSHKEIIHIILLNYTVTIVFDACCSLNRKRKRPERKRLFRSSQQNVADTDQCCYRSAQKINLYNTNDL